MGKLRRTLALLTVAALLLSGLAVGALARPSGAGAYYGQVQNTWYFGLQHPNSGCHYDITVYVGYSVSMYCQYKDTYGYGSRAQGGDYRTWTCWSPPYCSFSGNIGSLGWDWQAYAVTMIASDNYSNQHGWIANAWPTP